MLRDARSCRWIITGWLLFGCSPSAGDPPRTDGTGGSSPAVTPTTTPTSVPTVPPATGGAPGGFNPPPVSTNEPERDAGMVRDPSCGAMEAIIRDFSPATHPDFELNVGFDWTNLFGVLSGLKGIVKPQLENGFPAYAHAGATTHTTGPLEFYRWYVDTPGINHTFRIPLALTETSPGQFVFDSTAFFPIDGQGFGNEGNDHNFHFTTEVRTQFTYRGGEVFTFRGDDDLWMFVNGHLVIDLGGLHGPLEATVNMDVEAARIGLVRGETYPMDIFHAERHTSQSNFRIQTNIDCFIAVEPPPPPPPPIIE